MGANNKITTMVFVLLLCLFAWNLKAQQLERTLISNAGGQDEAGDLKMEWSVGESVVAAYHTNEYRLTPGFHQGTDIVDQIFSPGAWAHDISIFPNPAGDELFLLKNGSGRFQIKIFDTVGKLIRIEIWNDIRKKLDVRTFQSGLYLIRIKDEQGAFACYKFIKQK